MVGLGDGLGDGLGEGEGLGTAARSPKLAQGDGGSTMQIWWVPGGELGMVTSRLKVPLTSAVVAPSGFLGVSQTMWTCSSGPKLLPPTVTWSPGDPVAVLSVSAAGGRGDGEGEGLGEGVVGGGGGCGVHGLWGMGQMFGG